MEKNPYKAKRLRVNESHRWTDIETKTLLHLIAEEVKNNPDSYEKPTARRFFHKIGTMSSILSTIDWVAMKSKMRYLKSNYLGAVNKIDSDPLQNEDENRVIQKTCPHFDLLQQIFGTRKNVIPSAICESTYEMDELIETIKDDENIFFKHSIIETAEQNNGESSSSFQENEPSKLSANQFKSPKKSRTNTSNSIEKLLSLQEKRLELEVKKFEAEIELKKSKQIQDFQLRKLEIEKEERVQRYELELKYKVNLI